MEETNNPKKQRGGARPGEGRKKLHAKYYGFNASPEAHEILEQIQGSKTDFINKAIIRAAQKH